MKRKEIPLIDYIQECSQANLSRVLGISQVAIHRAIKANRKIFICEENGEVVSAFEVRPFPHSPQSKNSRAKKEKARV